MPETLAIIQWDQAYNRNGNGKLPRAVLNVIRTYMNNRTLTGWVTAETLAEGTGMTVRNVWKQIAANVAAGWIEIVESGNSSKATVYRLTYPDPEPQFTVPDHETVSESSRSTPERCPTVHGNRVPQFTPTTPRTSPQEKFSTTPRTGNSGSPFGEPDLPDLKRQNETGHESRSLAVEGSEPTAENRPADSEPASAGAAEAPEEYRPIGLQPLARSSSVDPFVSEPAWRAEVVVSEKRAARLLEPASASHRIPDPFPS